MTTKEVLHARLQERLKCRLELRINQNRSTMLNLLDRSRSHARLSIHRIFLDAPDEVVDAVAGYVNQDRRGVNERNVLIREFIEKSHENIDYRDRLDKSSLTTKGKVYDLQEIYDEVNAEYFEGKLDLEITWFGSIPKKRLRRVTFGQYIDGLKLVKMHTMMDHEFFPRFFVSFVMYHEMLHHACPGVIDRAGRLRVHHKEFRRREKLYHDYERATAWEKKVQHRFYRRFFRGWA